MLLHLILLDSQQYLESGLGLTHNTYSRAMHMQVAISDNAAGTQDPEHWEHRNAGNLQKFQFLLLKATKLRKYIHTSPRTRIE